MEIWVNRLNAGRKKTILKLNLFYACINCLKSKVSAINKCIFKHMRGPLEKYCV